MGEHLKFANPEEKEYVELSSAYKLTEISLNTMANKLVTNYILMKGHRENVTVTFYGDEFDHRYRNEFDYEEFEDVTYEVLEFMMETHWKPDDSDFNWVFKKFKDAGKVERFIRLVEKIYVDENPIRKNIGEALDDFHASDSERKTGDGQ